MKRKMFYVLTYRGKTYIAQWKGGSVVLKEDKRSPDQVLIDATAQGLDIRYAGVSFGTKTTEGICQWFLSEIDQDAQWDWEPHSEVVVRG